MKFLKSLVACFSTYSRIPMPVIELDSEDMKYALIFFPLVGAVISVIEYCIFSVCISFGLPVFFRTLIMCAMPLIITGGIHIDGFMDTSDAFCSYGDIEKKLAIMKDPHTGAFAVIHLAIYGLIFIAFSYLINEDSIIYYCLSFIISRTLSGISVVTINDAKNDGMLHDMKKNAHKKNVLYALIIIYVITLFFISNQSIKIAILTLVFAFITFFIYKKKMMKELGGITGDTSGYYMCIMELILIIISSLGGYL